MYTFITSWKKFPEEIRRRWGEKSNSLLDIAIKVYHEKGGLAPFNVPPSGKVKKSKWG